MKKISVFLFLLVSLCAHGQYDFDRNDFFELAGNYSTLNQSGTVNILEPQEYSYTFETKAKYGAYMRYGKALTPFAHLVFSLGYHFEEIQNIDFGDTDGMLVSIKNQSHSFDLQLGPRIKIVGTEKFELSLRGGGYTRLSRLIKADLRPGYYGGVVVGFNFNERSQVNVKYSYENSIEENSRYALPLELSYHYKIY